LEPTRVLMWVTVASGMLLAGRIPGRPGQRGDRTLSTNVVVGGPVLWVAIIGLVMTVAAVAVAGRRALFLYKLATVGQPAPERVEHAKANVGAEVKAQLVEVFGQKKLLKWTPSGVDRKSTRLNSSH